MPTNHLQRRRFLKRVGTAGVLLGVGGAGTAAADPGEREGASAGSTIFDIVEGSGDFTILELALEETGLDAVLDSEDDQYTVFGPTDAAFAALLEALGVSAEELLARDDLADILLYHVTEGRRYSPSIVNPADVEMLNGETVTTEGATLNGGGLGGAEIVATDIEAANGVVHVIDGVLLP